MRYKVANSLSEAVALLSSQGGVSKILAGGSDLLVQIKSGGVSPDLLIDIKHIDGIKDITTEDGGYRIGAAVSGAELGEHSGVTALWPGVVEAVGLIGSTQVQGRATMVGNLCNGSPAADSVPAMIAADAVVRVVGPNGVREVPVADIPVSPGRTSLAKDDIVESVFLPARPERAGDAYLRFIPRTEMDIAVVGAAVSLSLADDGSVATARVALGAVAPTALRVADAEAALVGSKLDDATLGKLAAACSAACNPIDDKRGSIEFRTKVAGVMARRAALIAFERAGGAS